MGGEDQGSLVDKASRSNDKGSNNYRSLAFLIASLGHLMPPSIECRLLRAERDCTG